LNIEESLPSDFCKSGDFDKSRDFFRSGDFDKSRDFVTCSLIAEGILNGNQDLDQVVFTSVKSRIFNIIQRFISGNVLLCPQFFSLEETLFFVQLSCMTLSWTISSALTSFVDNVMDILEDNFVD
jgi:hypothetical protein